MGNHIFGGYETEERMVAGHWMSHWRWKCSCGSVGRWQSQSPACCKYAWRRHEKEAK